MLLKHLSCLVVSLSCVTLRSQQSESSFGLWEFISAELADSFRVRCELWEDQDMHVYLALTELAEYITLTDYGEMLYN